MLFTPTAALDFLEISQALRSELCLPHVSERIHVALKVLHCFERSISLLRTGFDGTPSLSIGHVAGEGALGFEHEYTVPYEFLHHRVDGCRQWNTHTLGGLFRIIAELLLHLYGQCRIHTTILLLV